MHQDHRASAVRRFFSGLTEYAFQARLGVADPPLVDCIAELLVRFVRSDNLYAVRSVRGPEARAGLAAVVSVVESRPQLADAVRRVLPEMKLAEVAA